MRWTGKTVPAGGTLTVRFTVQVSSSLPDGATITNGDYRVRCIQVPMPVMGAPVTITVTVEEWQIYLPIITRNYTPGG